MTSEFRNSFAEDIFYHKYAQGHNDSWHNLAIRLIDDVCGTQGGKLHPILSKEERDYLVEAIRTFKFIPGGRYLYYAGRQAHFWNNCLGGETKILTDTGLVALSEVVGETINVMSPVDGKFYPAEIINHGKQQLNTITFAPVRGNSKITYTVRATRTHHWPLQDGTDTYDLRIGDKVPANSQSLMDWAGFIHGFVYGDGNANGQLRLCADKDKKWLDLLAEHGTVTYPKSAMGDPVLYFGKHKEWKSLPLTESPQYIAGFIRGWLQADGSEISGNKLCCIDKQAMEWFRDNAAYAGIVISGELRSQIRDTAIGEYEYADHEIFIQNYSYGNAWGGFKVIDITTSEVEDVYCPYEPVHNRFILENNIDTFNCYLLKAKEDTREEWANLTRRAMSALMSGGGIGIDYSVLRPEGLALGRTGGKASGPIPLMHAINEIGRNVMQGGSRRSAIYASLNWQHDDAHKFLVAKDWHNMIIHEGYSVWDAKQDNFNYPAPLDMTNISLNYDNEFIRQTFADGDGIYARLERKQSDWKKSAGLTKIIELPETFLRNVRQALMTGEPGFSFNFGDKENETLRNACTEVTSEDDSDVCNLGSINIGAVESLEEFKDIISAASKFLVCGTVRADLPYQEVHEVREKNRRLGLGLMGVHEWLLKRGEKYEVTPELHEWLSVYKEYSEVAADEHCDRLYLSHPAAYRAIAPTGSIGILAGTTTGIEPLLAVAYKRRYLKDKDRWHYQYVIDSTAEGLIQETGILPENIDTALALAADPERRIKFQADIQDYVDMSISSTINLPEWGSKLNNEDRVEDFAKLLAKYAPRLRGFTCYPDGSRGGQPLTAVSYEKAKEHKGVEYLEHDVCQITGMGGTCGS